MQHFLGLTGEKKTRQKADEFRAPAVQPKLKCYELSNLQVDLHHRHDHVLPVEHGAVPVAKRAANQRPAKLRVVEAIARTIRRKRWQ